MGMNLARDVRSANLAAAERRERSKFRDREDARAERAATRADKTLTLQENRDKRDERASKRDKRESDVRIKSLKSGMKRSRKKTSYSRKNRNCRGSCWDSSCKLLNEKQAIEKPNH